MNKTKNKAKSKKKAIIISAVALFVVIACAIGAYEYYERSAYFCQYAKQFSVSEVKGGENVTLIAHRGLATEAPENTLPAYELAAKKGFKYAETDIMPSKDGVWMISHDDSLKRMTGDKVNVADLTAEEISKIPLTKGANIKDYQNLVTPTYEQFLKTCADNNIIPVVEIKLSDDAPADLPYEDIVTLLDKYGFSDNGIIISFSENSLKAVRKYSTRVKMQFLASDINEDTFKTAKEISNCGLDIKYQALLKNPDMVKKAISENVELNAWTVDDLKIANELTALGVTIITTNAIMPK